MGSAGTGGGPAKGLETVDEFLVMPRGETAAVRAVRYRMLHLSDLGGEEVRIEVSRIIG